MNHKFTADGKKVAVIGALNAKETIVQEIFVTDGTEFPAGEHFVVKTLLDAPAETYKAKRERELEDHIKRLEGDRDRVAAEIAGLRFKASAATAKVKWIEKITEPEVRDVFDNIKAMLSGEYTHVVIPGYQGVEIKEWDERLFTSCESGSRNRFDSLRMVSLYGQWKDRLTMGWKVNSYQDGSGSSTTFFPCRSLQEAIEKAREILYSKEHLSDGDFNSCVKYGIPIDEAKNAARLASKAKCIKQQIADSQERTRKLEADLLQVN